MDEYNENVYSSAYSQWAAKDFKMFQSSGISLKHSWKLVRNFLLIFSYLNFVFQFVSRISVFSLFYLVGSTKTCRKLQKVWKGLV